MRTLLMLAAFMLGFIAGSKLIHIERSGEGEDEVNIYIIVGVVNRIPARFPEKTNIPVESVA